MSIPESVLQSLRKQFWPLLCVQLPAAFINPIQDLCDLWIENNPVVGLLVFLPFLFLTSFISSAGTYRVLQHQDSGPRALSLAASRWRLLSPASILVGTLVLLGLVALVVPGIYFAAMYLFVPYLIMEEEGLALTAYMHRSKQLAKSRQLKTILLVSMAFLVMIWTFLFGDWLAGVLTAEMDGPFATKSVTMGVHLTLAILAGAVVDVWVCQYFFSLRGKE